MKKSAENSKTNVSNAAKEAGEKADLGAQPQNAAVATPPKSGTKAPKRSKKSEKASILPVDCILPGSSVHGSLQARTLEWVAVPSCRGSS